MILGIIFLFMFMGGFILANYAEDYLRLTLYHTGLITCLVGFMGLLIFTIVNFETFIDWLKI